MDERLSYDELLVRDHAIVHHLRAKPDVLQRLADRGAAEVLALAARGLVANGEDRHAQRLAGVHPLAPLSPRSPACS
jgi:hypothetical protein